MTWRPRPAKARRALPAHRHLDGEHPLSENPTERPDATPKPSSPRGALATIGQIALFAVAILIVIAMLLPAVRTAREPARRNSCSNNLKQIAIAILNYEAATGSFPPAYTVDDEGRRLHSWRTLILPFMEQATLYKSIDLSKPWDDPVNAKAREASLSVYACPSLELEDGFTTYLGVTGPHCAFNGSNPRKSADVADDRRGTLFVVDATADRAVHWMSPNDVSAEELVAFWPEQISNHAGVRLVAFLDGHVKAIQKDVDADVLRALTTINGGEALDE